MGVRSWPQQRCSFHSTAHSTHVIIVHGGDSLATSHVLPVISTFDRNSCHVNSVHSLVTASASSQEILWAVQGAGLVATCSIIRRECLKKELQREQESTPKDVYRVSLLGVVVSSYQPLLSGWVFIGVSLCRYYV